LLHLLQCIKNTFTQHLLNCLVNEQNTIPQQYILQFFTLSLEETTENGAINLRNLVGNIALVQTRNR
ncbi:MAG: hypothetical protein WBP64_20525, partial [Nitrososphaeraceae archaeon]